MQEEEVSFGIVISKELKTRLKMYCAKNAIKIKYPFSDTYDKYFKKKAF